MQSKLIDRRSLLFYGAATLATFSGNRGLANKQLNIPNAYSIWYNRPAAIGNLRGDVTLVGAISNTGISSVHKIHNNQIASTITVNQFNVVSDHGSPVVLEMGNWAIVANANHSSELSVGVLNVENMLFELPMKTIDSQRCTYPSLVKTGPVSALLFYTVEEYSTDDYSKNNRKYVVRETNDSGQSWGRPKTVIPKIAGLYPYPVTPLFDENQSRLAVCYSILRITADFKYPVEDIHIAMSNDMGETWQRNRVWTSVRNQMFQVFDACLVGGHIRVVCLHANGPWSSKWSSIRVYVVEFSTSEINKATFSEVSKMGAWGRYPFGATFDIRDPNRLYVSEGPNHKPDLVEYTKMANVWMKDVNHKALGGLFFPFQDTSGNLFAHTNYRSASSSNFYADIVTVN